MKNLRFLTMLIILTALLSGTAMADKSLETLKQDQSVQGFRVMNIYDNAQGDALGARFISEKKGFILDIMRIQSVPQAFMWVKSMPTTSMGRPHACEHLLLGKGNKGRYVSAQEDMMLSNSSAFTMQLRTCYHFNTVAGVDAFYEIFEAKLDALLNPNFTDEEIQREVCHIGVNENPETGELSIDEKGTVYTEMVSGFEKPWYYYGYVLNKMVFGEGHPISNSAGGDPDVMRDMTPDDMWKFIKEYYHLSNLGAIVSIPSEVDLEDFLKKMNAILENVQDFDDKSEFVGLTKFDFPPQTPLPVGTKKITEYPSDKDSDFGHMMYAWPSLYNIDRKELPLLELFWSTVVSGQTSNLYKIFINSETQQINLGAQYVFGGLDSEQGISPYIGIGNMENRHISENMLDSVGAMMIDEFRRISNFEDDSEELLEFNREVSSRLISQKKQWENYLNSPPMFGFRSGAGAGWMGLLSELEYEKGFRKSLLMDDRVKEMEEKIASGKNIWSDLIAKTKILEIPAFAVGSKPNTEIFAQIATAKNKRIRGYIDGYKKKYGVDNDQDAIAAYKKDFDANTAELEKLAADQSLPEFINNPPLYLDEQLQYETIKLDNGIPLFASTFENMTSSTVSLYLDLHVVPESLLVYMPLLPSLLTSIGVYDDNGIPIKYEEMSERRRNEILGLGANYTNSSDMNRLELILTGQAGSFDELGNAIGWMDMALNSPYLSTDNLPRISDVINQSLGSYRDRTKSPEEYWVNNPANAYRFQNNPLYLSTMSFMTEAHLMSRLKWQFIDAGDESTTAELIGVIDSLAGITDAGDRDYLISVLENLAREGDELAKDDELAFVSFGDQCRSLVCEIANELKQTLADIPDKNLAADWKYLCAQIKEDLLVKPEIALERVTLVLDYLKKADIARMVMVSNSADRNNAMKMINQFAGKLDSDTKSVIQKYSDKQLVINNLKSRESDADKPVYVGLKYDGTRNGVIIFTSRLTEKYDTSEEAILNCLAGKMFSGGGPHGFFMKTWGAGLAYSNGYGIGEASGLCRYYAERCPDIAETMKFVVNLIKDAETNPELVNYAIAQVFSASRAQSRYESRGAQMADNFEDGVPPEKVKAYREKVLELRNDPDLHAKLVERMEKAYGPVFIGYGEKSSESRDGVYFLIGPDQQFESMGKYIESAEGKQPIYKLFPRDYWIKI